MAIDVAGKPLFLSSKPHILKNLGIWESSGDAVTCHFIWILVMTGSNPFRVRKEGEFLVSSFISISTQP